MRGMTLGPAHKEADAKAKDVHHMAAMWLGTHRPPSFVNGVFTSFTLAKLQIDSSVRIVDPV